MIYSSTKKKPTVTLSLNSIEPSLGSRLNHFIQQFAQRVSEAAWLSPSTNWLLDIDH